jgi:hypothetical protein
MFQDLLRFWETAETWMLLINTGIVAHGALLIRTPVMTTASGYLRPGSNACAIWSSSSLRRVRLAGTTVILPSRMKAGVWRVGAETVSVMTHLPSSMAPLCPGWPA